VRSRGSANGWTKESVVVAEFWVCEGCYDLTENEPDHRGVCLCDGCGAGHAAAVVTGDGVTPQRAENPVPGTILRWLRAKGIE
jgi:hypothetical protein